MIVLEATFHYISKFHLSSAKSFVTTNHHYDHSLTWRGVFEEGHNEDNRKQPVNKFKMSGKSSLSQVNSVTSLSLVIPGSALACPGSGPIRSTSNQFTEQG